MFTLSLFSQLISIFTLVLGWGLLLYVALASYFEDEQKRYLFFDRFTYADSKKQLSVRLFSFLGWVLMLLGSMGLSPQPHSFLFTLGDIVYFTVATWIAIRILLLFCVTLTLLWRRIFRNEDEASEFEDLL